MRGATCPRLNLLQPAFSPASLNALPEVVVERMGPRLLQIFQAVEVHPVICFVGAIDAIVTVPDAPLPACHLSLVVFV